MFFRIQKSRQIMCLEESFCPFIGMHWIFGHRKYMPCRTAQQCSGFSPSAVITVPCDAPFNILLYHLLRYRSCSPEKPTRNVYVMLVYLFLFAVVLLCCDMLWYNLLHWTSPRYALLIFADNTALPGFIIFLYMIYAIWWTLTHITRSYLFMNGWQRRTFSCSTHTEVRVMSRWGHKHTNNISRTAHYMSDSQFHSSKTILISYTLRNVKIFTAARQNKIWPIQAHTYPSWYDFCPLFSPFEYIRHCFAYC